MKTAVVNFKTEPETKNEAKRIAKNLGFNLSSLMNGFLHDLINRRRISFGDEGNLELKDEVWEEIKKSEADDECSPSFDNAKDMVAWLEDDSRKYVKCSK